jgi:hypothetical protein
MTAAVAAGPAPYLSAYPERRTLRVQSNERPLAFLTRSCRHYATWRPGETLELAAQAGRLITSTATRTPGTPIYTGASVAQQLGAFTAPLATLLRPNFGYGSLVATLSKQGVLVPTTLVVLAKPVEGEAPEHFNARIAETYVASLRRVFNATPAVLATYDTSNRLTVHVTVVL